MQNKSFIEQDKEFSDSQKKRLTDGKKAEQINREYRKQQLALEEELAEEQLQLEEQFQVEKEEILQNHRDRYEEKERVLNATYEAKEKELEEQHNKIIEEQIEDPEVKEHAKSGGSDPEPKPKAPDTDDDFAELKQLIKDDSVEFSSNDVLNTFMSHPILRNVRENAFVMETGEHVKVQPIRLTDGNYKVVSMATIEEVAKQTKIDQVEWVADVSDCEDICLRFNSRCLELGMNSCGRIMSWSGNHCFIVFLYRTEDNQVNFAFFEPQTDQFVALDSEPKYSSENCFMIIN